MTFTSPFLHFTAISHLGYSWSEAYNECPANGKTYLSLLYINDLYDEVIWCELSSDSSLIPNQDNGDISFGLPGFPAL